MRIAVIFLAICSGLAAQDASMRGIVVDSVTRQPLTGAHVTAFAITDGQPDQAYGAISRLDGRFSISGLKPGTYYLMLQKTGFIYVPDKDTGLDIVLKTGEQRMDLTLPMAQEAAITGRVTDEFGDPVQRANIEVAPVAENGSMRLQGAVSTDERGRFRVLAAPGKYYVKATLRPQQVSMAPEVRSDGTQPVVYAATWYPASESKEHGVVVDLPPGHDAAGIDIRLAPQRSLSINGTVIGVPAGRQSAVVYLTPADYPQNPGNLRNTMAGKDGKFSITAVAPGNYRAVCMVTNGSGGWQMRSRYVDIRVDNADTTVVLQVFAPEEMAGSIVFDGTPPAEKRAVVLGALTQSERSFGGTSLQGSGDVDGDGNFKLTEVFPGKARVMLNPMPENAYIKSVRIDSAETPGDLVDLSNGVQGSRLRVSMGLNGARVEGSLLEADGQPQKSAIVLVALAASGEDVSFETAKSVRPGAKFTFTGMRPGKYRFYIVDPAKLVNASAISKDMLIEGPEMELHAGDRIETDVRIPATLNGKEKPGAK